MPELLDVISVADLCVDLILSGNVRPRFGQIEQLVGDYSLELGGSAGIFASQFVKLGGRAGLVGAAGCDLFGSFALEKLAQSGVETSRIRRDATLKTGLGVALAEANDRAILTYSGTIDAVTPGELTPQLATAARHWHIASYFLLAKLRDAWPEWLPQLRTRGVTVSLDTNWDPQNEWRGVLQLLEHVDVFLPNEAEALAITRANDVDAAGAALAERAELIVIKRGADGASAYSRGRRWHARPASSHIDIVDAIGAGDSFDAGFLRAWQLGHSIEDSLAWGVRCGQASLSAAGGIAGQLSQTIPQEDNHALHRIAARAS